MAGPCQAQFLRLHELILLANADENSMRREKRDAMLKRGKGITFKQGSYSLGMVGTVPVLALWGGSDFGDGRKANLDGVGGGVFQRGAMRNAKRLLGTLIEKGEL